MARPETGVARRLAAADLVSEFLILNQAASVASASPGEVIKAAAADSMMGGRVGQGLPAANDRVDVKRIELQPITTAAAALGGDW